MATREFTRSVVVSPYLEASVGKGEVHRQCVSLSVLSATSALGNLTGFMMLEMHHLSMQSPKLVANFAHSLRLFISVLLFDAFYLILLLKNAYLVGIIINKNDSEWERHQVGLSKALVVCINAEHVV